MLRAPDTRTRLVNSDLSSMADYSEGQMENAEQLTQ